MSSSHRPILTPLPRRGATIAARPADEASPYLRIGRLLVLTRTAARADEPVSQLDAERVLYEVADLVSQATERDAILRGVLAVLRAATIADHASVLLPDPQGELVEATGDASVSQTILGEAVREGMGVVVLQAQQDDRYQNATSVTLHRLGSVLCAPLLRERRPVLVLYLARNPDKPPFGASDLDLVYAAGQQLVVALGRFDAQEELLSLASTLSTRERLSTAGQIAAGVMHDIRNLVGAASSHVALALEAQRGLAERLAAGHAADVASTVAETVTDLTAAEEATSALLKVCKGMMDLVRRPAPAQRPVDVCAVLRSAVALSRGEVRRVATVLFDESRPVHVMGDSGGLTQVFVNLLMNAAQAMDEMRAAANRITIEVEPTPERVGVHVADNGCGMTPEVLKSIFQPLFTTRGDAGGTGLGLAISSDIVAALGGEIAVESAPGAGSCFTVWLRRAPG